MPQPSCRLDSLLIVALGASAGGLEPLEQFFESLPPDCDMAFVVVQHLSPDHSSALPELLSRCTRMDVEQASDGSKIVANHVYIIPPNATLTITNATLHVSPPLEARGLRAPIDTLFRSLAEDCGENSVCIMLSGTGTDGTLGLRAVKEHGGMAMAQTLESAKYDAIIRSAIATGLVDHVLSVEEMPAKLMEYAAHLNSLDRQPNQIREQISREIGRIHTVLNRRAGHDFSEYKEGTIVRRVERRMKALQIDSVEQYIEVLEKQPEQADLLFKDLLIGVTGFFRDPLAFEALDHEVIPDLFAARKPGGPIRVCVVGCASGEEAYSIAILLCEHASRLDDPPDMKIFATDIDERGLEMARKGRYPRSVAEQVSAERLDRFFTLQDNAYQVKRELREMCLFSSHNFIKDPPFSRIDLISCRNVMIYLGETLQRKMVPLFHYALRSGGYLFLGPSEGINSHRDLFAPADKKNRIFRRMDGLPHHTIPFPLSDIARTRRSAASAPEASEQTLAKRLERIILQHYAPACVVVRENGDALYFSDGVSRYLEQPAGTPDFNVVNISRESLRVPLRTALHRVAISREPVVHKHIPVQTNGAISHVDVTVAPLRDLPDASLYIIVIAEAVPEPEQTPAPSFAPVAGSDDIIRHLEGELRSAQEHAQAMFEELESSNEELKSANEEYQSTNEELETSKEELQSFNEELETVNSELNRRVTELDSANSDLQNLHNSTQIATVFLDSDLRIRSYTTAAARLFRLIGSDIGRPITDLASQVIDADLVEDARQVLTALSPRERQVGGVDGRHYQKSVLPYRTVHNVIAGVVLTFVDTTLLNEAEQRAQAAQAYAESIVDTVREPLVVLDSNLYVKSASTAFYEVFGGAPGNTLDKPFYDVGTHEWDIPELRRMLTQVLTDDETVLDREWELQSPKLGKRTILLKTRPLKHGDSREPLILLAIEDITGRKRIERERREIDERERVLAIASALREKEAELARVSRALTVGEMATSIAHEVNQPLAAIVTNAEAGLRWLGHQTPNLSEARESLALIVADGNRASAVIRRIHQLLKKESQQFTPLDMNQVAEEAIALTRAELVSNRVALRVELSPSLPQVSGDGIQLQQVILNLLVNGCEAITPVPDGRRELVVSSKRSLDGVVVAVRDSGPGASPQELGRMFDAFFTTKPAGMGMGLAISRSIVEAHGGRIWAVENEDSGLTVQFSLPQDRGNPS